MLCRLVACLLAVAVLSTPVVAGQDPSSKALLTLAARYVATFVERFSNVRAEEHYIQDWKTNTGLLLSHRELTSDFLLTRVADSSSWQAFRDVFAVNGTAVRDSQDRLTKLFLQPSAQALLQAATIAAESARYNISNVQRTVNQPLFVFIFLQPDFQGRFSFSVDKLDRAYGQNVWIVDYRETSRPTVVRGTADKDLPARGRFWIDRTTGRIVRTELSLEDNLQSAQISATFSHDDRFQIDVPVGMEEQYSVKGNAGKVSAKATYGRFRQFQVSTAERMQEPK